MTEREIYDKRKITYGLFLFGILVSIILLVYGVIGSLPIYIYASIMEVIVISIIVSSRLKFLSLYENLHENENGDKWQYMED